jgi:hypothetical protein
MEGLGKKYFCGYQKKLPTSAPYNLFKKNRGRGFVHEND